MDGSRPRHQHPSPSHPAVAKIAPMVPEVSLFFGGRDIRQEQVQRSQFNVRQKNVFGQQQRMNYSPAEDYNRFYSSPVHPAYNNSIGSPLPPPMPTNRLLQNTTRPSEFSRNFENLSLSESLHSNGNQAHNYLATTTTESNNNREKVNFVDYVQPLASHSPLCQLSRRKDGESKAHYSYDSDFRQGPRESKSADDSPLPPDILKVLNWQNDQLKLLQEQVSALLQASPQHNQKQHQHQQQYPILGDSKANEEEPIKANTNIPAENECGENQWNVVNNKSGAYSQSASKDINKDILDVQNTDGNTEGYSKQNGVNASASSGNQRSVATNTSTLWPEIQNGLRKLTEALNEEEEEDSYSNAGEIRKSAIRVNNSDNESAQSAINIDLPDYPASDCSPDLKKQQAVTNSWDSPVQAGNSWQSPGQAGNSCATSWESPVLGESVSMYEAEKIQGVYTDILSKVNRLLAEPTENSRDSGESQGENKGSQGGKEEIQNSGTSIAVATCNRLRQLGVSFISPEDLFGGSTLPSYQHQQTAMNEVSTLFLPRATQPSESVWQQSPDTSLEISSLALKYLDESQLSKLAMAHHSKGKSSSNVSAIQNSDVNMSLATQQFLNRYGLAANTGDTSPSLKPDRRPLTPIQNNPVTAAATAAGGSKQMLELRREVLRGKYITKEVGGANYAHAGENYCVENYEMRYNIEGAQHQCGGERQHSNTQQQQVRFDNNSRTPQHQQQPEVKNRILDITAIRSQPKFL
jgi:hypothetical protein